MTPIACVPSTPGMAILHLQTHRALTIINSRHTPHMTSSENSGSHPLHTQNTQAQGQHGRQFVSPTLHHDLLSEIPRDAETARACFWITCTKIGGRLGRRQRASLVVLCRGIVCPMPKWDIASEHCYFQSIRNNQNCLAGEYVPKRLGLGDFFKTQTVMPSTEVNPRTLLWLGGVELAAYGITLYPIL